MAKTTPYSATSLRVSVGLMCYTKLYI